LRTREQDAAVNWLRTFVVLAVLAIWVPASSHAFLQQADLIHHHHDAEDHHGDGEAHDHGPSDAKDHDAADGICRVESQSAKAPCPVLAILFVIQECESDFAPTFVQETDHSGPSPPGTAPPRPSGPRAPPFV
jgi:hypothetical protein